MVEQIRPLKQGKEEVDTNIREHLDLRLRFAEEMSKVRGISIANAVRQYTDLYIRITGKWSTEEQDPTLWKDHVHDLEDKTHGERLAMLVDAYKNYPADRKDHSGDEFWPFRYGYDEQTGEVDLHFGSMDFSRLSNEKSFLSSEREQEMRQKLKGLFLKIKADYPDARTVTCRSWLFSKEELRKFFPDSFSPQESAKGGYQGGSRWGQFYAPTGHINQKNKKIFLKNISVLKKDDLESAFPQKTYEVAAPIHDFYRFYGIE